MLRSPKSRQSALNVDNYRTLSELGMRSPTPTRTSHQLSSRQDDEDNNNRTIRKLVSHQPMNPSRNYTSSTTSLKSMVIDGRWKYRANDGSDDDNDEVNRLRLQSLGIEHLVRVCHDIMKSKTEISHRKDDRRAKSPVTSNGLPVIRLDAYKKLTSADRSALNRAHLFDLMTIVYEAVSTDVSMAQLVRIWREASEHVRNPRPLERSTESQPLISYVQAINQLIRTPNDHILQIAVHASLVTLRKRSDLLRLGNKLGIDKNEFDIRSIHTSFQAFQYMVKFLREQKLREKEEQQFIDRKRLPYKRRKKQGLHANVTGTKFRLICEAMDVAGFYITPASDFTCNLLWNDTLISMDIVSALKPYQKVNHFPTMNEISRKDLLAKNYDQIRSFLPKEYNFAPKTWTLPNDYNLWYSYATNRPHKDSATYIMKPNNTAMGHGIAIHCNYKQVKKLDNYIIQEYIREPYLLDGFKFDLRIYALITSCDPLRVFIFNNGLVRLSSKKYQLPTPINVLDYAMHLTNYSITKKNPDDLDLDSSKRRSLQQLFDYLKRDNHDVEKLWTEIKNIITKTIFLAEPHMSSAYRTCRPAALPTSESVCFELLGFDILIDKNLKPWIIEVNRCPSFDTSEQIEFDIKMKLLCDTLNLLHFQVSDREKSDAIEKVEAQRRLYLSIGKPFNTQRDQVEQLKEILFLLRRERARDIFESHHCGGFVRLFPVDDDKRMNGLMHTLSKCFHILSPTPYNLSRYVNYTQQYDERELIQKIEQLETTKRPASIKSAGLYRASSLTTFTYGFGDDEEEKPRESSPSPNRTQQSSLKEDTFSKRVGTQTPADILRTTSAAPKTKKRSNSLVSTGRVSRSESDSHQTLPGVSASRITEKKFYTTSSSSEYREQEQRVPSPKVRRSNNKSQMVTQSAILHANLQQQQSLNQTTPTTIDITKEYHLTNDDLCRLSELIFNEMNKLRIHYPNRTDQETNRLCITITENWAEYKADIGRFWLVELDANKRESIIQMVWINVQQIIKKICIIDELAQHLPLNRHLSKIERRLLANHGQCMWETCQNRHNSWELLFMKGNNPLSDIELKCCYRFVDMCKEALFIVYRYSNDEKFQKQKQLNSHVTLMIKS
ncbi:unnamed protein product [Adineta ricciae]|uniref:Uncharacterized protein n=1 Tax=Adineta ricciae TaxID=249248 RepID=A0A815RU03_ADIRI|nr:unnamed protein product [Adineta ricciae]CAF1481536.1 unnamed protein product [Adineta ricciae]